MTNHIIDDPLYKAALEKKEKILNDMRKSKGLSPNLTNPSYEPPMISPPCHYYPCEINDNF